MVASAQADKFKRIAKSPYLFALNYLKIQDKDDHIVSFKMNPLQIHYLQHRTSRDLILKPRQIGFSTAIQAEIFRYSVTRPTRSLTLTDEGANTTKMRLIQDKFYNNLPEHFRPKRSISNATLTIYPEYNSEVLSGTAGNTNVGRAGSYRIQHYSEIAMYPDAGSIMKSALQGGRPMWVVAESTANGAHGWFFERCMEALNDQKSAWTLHFYAWFNHPEYIKPLADGEELNPTPEEEDLIERYGVTVGQLNWRRWKISESDKRTFEQEYPTDPRSCFLASGAGYFASIPHLNERLISNPHATPQQGREYVLGVDIGQSNDFTVISVIDVQTQTEVELVRFNRLPMTGIADKIIATIEKWQPRVAIIERNFDHMLVENIDDHFLGSDIDIMAFNMTVKSKPPLIKGMYHALETGGLHLLRDESGDDELRKFEVRQTPNGHWKYEAPNGSHDDTVIARALANRMIHYVSPLEGF